MRSGRFANRPDAQYSGAFLRRTGSEGADAHRTAEVTAVSPTLLAARATGQSGGCSRASHRFALPAFMVSDTGYSTGYYARWPRNRSILTFRQQLPQVGNLVGCGFFPGMVVGVLDADPAVEAFLAQDA